MLVDLKYASRRLLKSPSFAITAILTLALGIGANAVVFSVLNGLVLHTLNVPDAQTFYSIEERDQSFISYPDYLDLRDRNRSFEGVLAFNFAAAGLDTGSDPSQIWLYEASGNYFDTLGIKPYLGRFFQRSDEHGPNSSPYIVLSYDYWRSHFEADPGVIGRTVQLNKHPFTVLGVAGPGFRGTERFFSPALWVPMVDQEQIEGFNDLNLRTGRSLWLIGRVKPGVTAAQADADLHSIATFLTKTYPKDDDGLTLLAGASRPSGQPAGAAGPRFCGRPDVIGRADSAGRLRQPGQPVCGARGRPFARDCLAPRAWVEPTPHSAPASDRGNSGCTGGRGRGYCRQRGPVARIERLAAAVEYPYQPAGAVRTC